MRALGIDASSTRTGVAYADGQELLWTATWKPPNRLTKPGQRVPRMFDYEAWLSRLLDERLDAYAVAVIELASNHRAGQQNRVNRTTITVLARYEAVSMTVCNAHGMQVLEAEASRVRSKVFPGQGRLDKARTHELVQARYPDHTFASPDEMDAAVNALAAPSLLLAV